jgi:hypothetical protein
MPRNYFKLKLAVFEVSRIYYEPQWILKGESSA